MGIRHTRRRDVYRDDCLFPRAQEVRAYSARGSWTLLRPVQRRGEPESHWEPAHSHTFRRHVLGAVAAELFFVGEAGRKTGSSHIWARVPAGADPNGESWIRAAHAASLLLRDLSAAGQSVAADTAAENWHG